MRPRSRSVQMRLAVGVTALALGVAALAGLGAAALAAWRGPKPQPTTYTRVEQVGDQIAVVQLQQNTGSGAAAAAARQSAVRWLLVTLGVSFVPAAALAWMMAGRVLRPVHRVAQVAEQVNAPTDAGRAAVSTDDELGRMAAGFDRMLDRLDERERQQRQALQEVVHELRTPLAIATTNLELDGPEHVAAARRALERMARTVDDLAAHGRLHVGAAVEPVNLTTEVWDLASEHAGPAQARGVRITVQGSDVFAPADPVAVRTAVGNVLSNAARLAPTGSTVTLAIGRHEGWAFVAVHDEGPGIAPEDHAAVFERHWTGRYERDREAQGGLGLTIARQAVEANGGHLTVSSAVGMGSTFVVWLPVTADARREDAVAPDGVHSAVEPVAAAAH